MFFFLFNDTATTEIYTLSLHDALPICAPLIRLGIFRVRSLVAANVVMLFVASGMFAMFFFASLYAQQVLGYDRSEEHTSELQSRPYLVCRLLLEKKNYATRRKISSAAT